MAAEVLTAPPRPGAPARHERWFGAMGTVCHVVVLDGPEQLALDAEDEVRRLEGLWSRFRADSEVSRLNASTGAWMPVSEETIELLDRANTAWRRLEGWFDPFMAADLVACGYDRDLSLLDTPEPTAAAMPSPEDSRRTVQRVPLELDQAGRRARLHGGATFDPGGIGKGLAADLVSEHLLRHGAAGALVNLGGDLRARGDAPPKGWRIAIEHPLDRAAAAVATFGVTDSGLCTSTMLRRRWTDPQGRAAHHVLDPRTGRPAPVEVASVTATATDAWLAEALATAVLLAGPVDGARMVAELDATALAVHLDGRLQRL